MMKMTLFTLITAVIVIASTQADDNIAINKPVMQSSTDTSADGFAERAVDGNTNGIFWKDSCASTKNEAQAWWAVDLGKSFSVTRVVVHNRVDCCSNRLSDFQVGVMTISPLDMAPEVSKYPLCGAYPGTVGPGASADITCNAEAIGRYLVVQLKGANFLTLCEVEVFGVPAETTEAPQVTCPKERASFLSNDIPVEPTFTDGCKFEPKQCNSEKCWCVKPKTGMVTFGKIVVPLVEDYDCKKKPRKCFVKRFSLLNKSPPPSFIPVCTKNGNYAQEQCHAGECWCVKPRGGYEIKRTRAKSSVICSK